MDAHTPQLAANSLLSGLLCLPLRRLACAPSVAGLSPRHGSLARQAAAAPRASTPRLPRGAAVPAPAAVQVFQLTVAVLRAAERQPAPSAPASVPPALGQAAVRRHKRETLLGLARWVQTHAHLRACPVSDGIPTVALLLLWEVDHGAVSPVSPGR